MPYASSYKVAVINDADRLTPEAQNSLLKTLEEPAEQTIIALVTRNYSKLLPTILSRCSVYQLEDEGESKNSVDGDNFFNAKAFYRADYLERLKIIVDLLIKIMRITRESWH
jgi:DNA polymerase III delta prime subunit